MPPRKQQRLTIKADIFKAMGQPTRLKILELLQANEMQAVQITAQIGTEAPTVSKHLSLLRKQGLIAERKEASKVFYYGTSPHVIGFMWCAENAVRQRLNGQMNPRVDS
jgi:DNA-binding transcriptional ArsR family regulator